MADIDKHALVGISINGSTISAIEPDSIQVSPNMQAALERGGEIHPQIGLTLTNEPMISFDTTKLDLVSAATPIGVNTVQLFFRAFSDGDGYGSGYISMSVSNGLLVPSQISGQSGQKATLSMEIHPTSSDGDSEPITTGTITGTFTAVSEVYTVGDATVGSALTGVQNVTLDWGYQIEKNTGENGKVFPTQAYVDNQQASLQVTTAQLSAASQNMINFGTAETTVSQTFRMLAEGGAPTVTYTATLAKAFATIEQISNRPVTAQINAAGIESSDSYLSFA